MPEGSPDPDRLLAQGDALQDHADGLLAQLRAALDAEERGARRAARIAVLRRALEDVGRMRDAARKGDAAVRQVVQARLGRGPFRLKAPADALNLSLRARERRASEEP